MDLGMIMIKITQFVEYFTKNKLDIVMITETNSKWDTRTIEKIKFKMKEIGRNIQVTYIVSKAYNTTRSDWLLGGMMTVIRGNISSLLQKDKVKIDSLGKQMAYQVSNGTKTILFIIIYRIPQSTNEGIYKAITQYN